jgi:MFS family permease
MLGVLESAVMPSLLILQSRWFTKSERARANAVLLLGNPVTIMWMSLLSGVLASHLGWRMMFIVEGLPPVLWALIWWLLISDRPREASWLADSDRMALEAKLAEEQRGIAPVANYAAAIKSRSVILLAAQHFFWSIGVYGFVIWLPSMIKTADMNMTMVGLLSAVPFLAAAIAEVAASTWSDLTGRRQGVLWPCMLIGAAAFYGSYLLGGSHFWLGFVLLVIAGAAMYAPYGPFFAYIVETVPTNVTAGAIGLINCMGALGSFVGAYGVGLLNGATGSSSASYLMMAAGLVVTAVLVLAMPKRATV